MITHGVILPGSQSDEAKELMVGLAERGVVGWQVYIIIAGTEIHTMVFDVPEGELGKLPSDDNGPYLGDDESGHAFCEISNERMRSLSAEGTNTFIAQSPPAKATFEGEVP